MIIDVEQLSMSEVPKYLGKEDAEKEMQEFIKKFAKLNSKEATELRQKLSELGIIKINEHQICKIVDFLPEREDLNKLIGDANLDEDETKKILDTVKEFK